MSNQRRTSRHTHNGSVVCRATRRKGIAGRSSSRRTLCCTRADNLCETSVLVAVAEEQQGHLPARGNPQDIYTTEKYHVLLCSKGEDDSCG
eukprot:3534249-Pyramimonas_sp.AAC.1